MASQIPGLLLATFLYATLYIAGLLGARLARITHAADRHVFASAMLPASLVACVLLLGRLAVLTREALVLSITALSMAIVAATLSRKATPREPAFIADRDARLEVNCWAQRLIWAVAAFALVGAFTAAALLETWAWDSLGYHLPIAHDVVQVEHLRVIPGHIAYIETYPRFADLVTTAHRVLLGHERFVELSQWPFLPLLVSVGYRIASHLGLESASAWTAGITPLTLPIVYLQCATSYVDVAYAALLLAGLSYAAQRTERLHDVFATILLGLALATKPSAPTSIGSGLLVLAAAAAVKREHRVVARLAAIGAGAALVGGKVYADNWLRFGNPVWPVALQVGSLRLPGQVTQASILALGLSPGEQDWSWCRKLLTSWFLEIRPYVFDMRFGGFGPVFSYVALPVSLLAAVKSRGVRTLGLSIAAASLAQAGAFTSRYTIAFAAASMVITVVSLAAFGARHAFVLHGGFGLVLLLSSARGARGFSDGGPDLRAIYRMAERERSERVALDDHGADWFDIRQRLRPGEAFGYDLSFGLPSLAMRADGRSRLVYLGPIAPDGEELEAIADQERIRFLAIDRRRIRNLPPRFCRRFASTFDAADIYEVAPHSLSRVNGGTAEGRSGGDAQVSQ